MNRKKTEFNQILFAQRCKMTRGKTTLEIAALEIGNLSKATLQRIEQGNYTPDLLVFLSICDWLEEDPMTFLLGRLDENREGIPEQEQNYQRLTSLILSDTHLPQHSRELLSKIIELVYGIRYTKE